jgi:hypothetical protein
MHAAWLAEGAELLESRRKKPRELGLGYPRREPVHLNRVGEPENELVDNSKLSDAASQELELGIRWHLRNEDFPVEFAQCLPPCGASSDGHLSGSVRFPHIDQSLFGVAETLQF